MSSGKRSYESNQSLTKKKKNETIMVVESEDGEQEASGEDLEFEDEWEDEYEDEVVEQDDLDEENMEDDENMDNKEGKNELAGEDEEDDESDTKVFIPGRDKLEEGEVLEYDSSAYDMLHSMNVEWPCLSFDIVKDNLGENRTKFPMSCYIVAGTQADQPSNNKIMLMKMSQLPKTKNDDKELSDSEEEDDDEEEGDTDPILESKFLKHNGGVNRIRVMPNSNNNLITATWSDSGKVNIWDMTVLLRSLEAPHLSPGKIQNGPIYSFGGHPTEGFSMDWSTTVPGRLLTGDCKKFIYLWEMTESSWNVNLKPFTGHTDSVEDLQWSPNEKEVFASCSVDKTIKIWDARKREKSVLSVKAHESDVNVISWNRTTQHLMLSGCDDGSFSIWDLRNFKSGTPAAHFKWHTGPITSLQWCPSEDSVLAVAGADDQVSIWDLSLEQDSEAGKSANEPEVPPQLLFIHQGQQDVKEIHWHKQIPGMMISTAFSGFNIFKTISV